MRHIFVHGCRVQGRPLRRLWRRRCQGHRGRERRRPKVEVSALATMDPTPMQHPVAGVHHNVVAAYLPAQRAAMLRVLSLSVPPAATEEPYTGQECIGLGDAWRSLYALVQGSVRGHEGNSCLVLGESGCGKSLVRVPYLLSLLSQSFDESVASVQSVARRRLGSSRSQRSCTQRTASAWLQWHSSLWIRMRSHVAM